ncbi:serine/threonine-protein kinase BLUS1 isoform X2 [Pyrus x bretschneideri]|uniref:serine/threonine-protein kinase BLUS1 isoform X2 n=1 Tax=Pyrus x bretschneideri TaxID=225117 RepID=UPI00202FEA75|nr:serine/threonine-protein kinase BLUS1 isoform X2 [Pyrus x bretschneideri]
MEYESNKRFPLDAKDYKLYEEVGEGVSASVYRALCIPLNEIVAIKVLDLEKCNNDLDGIRREVNTMTLIKHQNLVRAHCSFTAGHSLWVVMPYMAGGSCLHIMKSSYPEGFEEPVIATLLHEVLKALVYLHAQGDIHRDVKAGNILIDSNGAVKLADFGVSACMFDAGDRQRSRNTFVGTPCWMAPEVMQQLHGYDFKADIWSFGITALELAHGHAPFSKYPPMKVLLMTLQNAPPGLDYERDKRFSKSFKEMVGACLVKDPKKRPSSEKLLKHHFFKHARPVEYLSRTILEGLSPLGERFRMLKAKEADLLVQNKALYGDEHLSQQEYIRGISAWNFNLEDLKNEAALIEEDGMPNASSEKQIDKDEDVSFPTKREATEMEIQSNAVPDQEDGFNNLHDLDNSLAAFPIKPLQALKGCFDVCEDDVSASSPRNIAQENGRSEDYVLSPKKVIGNGERDHLQSKHQPERSYSGPLLYRQKRDSIGHASAEDVSEGAVVQRKGRFKVTSADLSPMGPSNCLFGPSGSSTGPATANLAATTVLPSLQCILQQNTSQRDEIVKLIKYVEQTQGESTDASTGDLLQMALASSRERELQSLVINLQQSVGNLVEQLQRHKLKNAQLERQLKGMANKDENARNRSDA